MNLSSSPRTSFTSSTEEMWEESPPIEEPYLEELFEKPDILYKYTPCFIYNGCGLNEKGAAHFCCEAHFSETTQKVICACTTLSLLSCVVTPCLTIANCYLPQIYALVNTQPVTACVASTAISAVEATAAVFCAGSSVYCSCHHCKDQNV